MIAISFSVVEKSILNYISEISKHRMELKKRLGIIRTDSRLSTAQRRYANKMYCISRNIITARPSTINNYKRQFDKIITPAAMKSRSNTSFRKRLLKDLGYNEKRADFYPKYFQGIGIQACVYCNSMLTVAVEKVNRKAKRKGIIARFQVDHFLPKSEYPCFSISLYNLYPVCASCNNVKRTNEVNFKLYEDCSYIKSQFYFNLDMTSVVDYLLTRKGESIIYEFEEPIIKSKVFKSHNETFDIQGIYDTQKSIAEEIILKAEIYTKAYKDVLKKRFPTILTSSGITDRLIMGNYTSEKDIHKRPMAKFMIDLSTQVGLI